MKTEPAVGAHARVLGQLLLASGVITTDGLAAALKEQRSTRERLGEVLARQGTDPEAIARALASQLRLEYVAPPLRPDPSALRVVDSKLASRLRVIPVALTERLLRVAMADPLDAAAIDDLQFQTGRRVDPLVASRMSVDAALAAYHAGDVQAIVTRIPQRGGPNGEAETAEVVALRKASEAAPVVALVEAVLGRAIQAGASDVHVEPAGGALRVRARIDGVLREMFVLPAHAAGAFASRIKVMADMDISVKRRPQDGRASLRVDGRDFGLRVSTLPAQGGEKIVVRVLDPANASRDLEALGFDANTFERFGTLLGQSHGVILVTGPTGSGKTTTLYAALSRLDRRTRNVITLEDPVEYRLEGLTQVQVHKRAGLGFAPAMRAVLRQDPDVIMVGELRDKETVETAMAAAMTGHLVLSTVHTNDSPSAATRLSDMGAAPYLIAAGLIGVLAQRLVRRLCPHCAVEREALAFEQDTLVVAVPTVREAAGCHRCEGTGYRGRVGIFELLVVDSRIRELLARRAPVDVLRDGAVAAGMETLALDASRKVRDGQTTWAEVRPLLGLGASESRCPDCGAALRAAFRACVECGARVKMACACGALLDARWRHCPRCGQPSVKSGGRRTAGTPWAQSSPLGNGAGTVGTADAAGASLRAEA
jgi:type II secretory ATPase GspE/PulE/Tfp pilus assembly ATPase PilB-like protein